MSTHEQLYNGQHRRTLQQTEHSTAQSAAASGTGQGFDPSELANKEFVDAATEADLNRDLPDDHPDFLDVEELLKGALTKQNELANVPRKFWREERYMNNARAILAKMQFPEEQGLGKHCIGATRRRMTGDDTPVKFRTSDVAAQIDDGYRTATLKLSKGVSGWFFEKIADMTINTRSEGFDSEGGSQGWMDRISSALRGV